MAKITTPYRKIVQKTRIWNDNYFVKSGNITEINYLQRFALPGARKRATVCEFQARMSKICRQLGYGMTEFFFNGVFERNFVDFS